MKTIKFFLINGGLIFISSFIYEITSNTIGKYTSNYFQFDFFLFIIVFFICFFIFLDKEKTRSYCIGLAWFSCTMLWLIALVVNNSIIISEEKRTVQLQDIYNGDNYVRFTYSFESMHRDAEQSFALNLKVDSINVIVGKGILGAHILTDLVTIEHAKNCSDPSKVNFNSIDSLASVRCFKQPILFLTKYVKQFPSDYNLRYSRGKYFMLNRNYNAAIKDFESYLELKYNTLNNQERDKLDLIKQTQQIKLQVEELITNIQNQESQVSFSEYSHIVTRNEILHYIRACKSKLNGNSNH